MAVDIEKLMAEIRAMSDEDLTKLNTQVNMVVRERGLDEPPFDPDPPEESRQRQRQPEAAKVEKAGPSEQEAQAARGGSAVIYVDGSYDKKSEGYAYGMVVKREGQVDSYYAKAFPKDGASSMHNVAGELAGAEAAVRYGLDHGLTELKICHDYTGIGEWADGHWKANNPYTQGYKALVASAREKGLDITFEHVKGHTGQLDNEKCDELAKHALGIERSRDPMVQHAKPYESESEKAQTKQEAIGKALETYGLLVDRGRAEQTRIPGFGKEG